MQSLKMLPKNAFDAKTDYRLWEIIDPGPVWPLASVGYYAGNSGKKMEKIHYGVTTAVTFMHLSNTQLAHCKIMKIINTLPWVHILLCLD